MRAELYITELNTQAQRRNPISGTQFTQALELLTLSYPRNRPFLAPPLCTTTPPPGHVPLLIISALGMQSLCLHKASNHTIFFWSLKP